MNAVKEGNTCIFVEPKKIVDKKMPIFYNPVMIVNRDFSLLVLKALQKKDLFIGDVLAGSGIRSLRIIKELPSELIKKILVNDIKPLFCENFKKNIELNNLEEYKDKFLIKNEDANKALNNEGYFDYIEIDPFGTPVPFLDSSIRSLKRNGVLSITATDTSSLCGSYPKACKRKYWADPLRNELMHEFGTRILIRKVQLLGAQHEKALMPLVSYATDHYIKVFFQVANSKTKTDEILKKHKLYEDKGPIWTGEIQDKNFIKRMINETKKVSVSKKTIKILETLREESLIKKPFFYDMHITAKKQKAKSIPKLELVMDALRKKGFKTSRTHFCDTGIKTTAQKKDFENIFKELIK